MQRFFEIVKSAGQISGAEWIRRRTERFLSAQNINIGFGKELIDVQKVRPAKHVVGNRDTLLGFREVLCFPIVHGWQLAPVQLGESFLKISSMLLPGWVARKCSQGRLFRDRHSGEESRRVVGW